MSANIDELVADVLASDAGPHVGAFFDFDRTLIAGYSVNAFMMEQIKSRSVSPGDLMTQVNAAVRYSRGDRNFSDLISTTTELLQGRPESSFVEMGEKVHEKKLAAAIYPEARRLLDAHRKMDHTIAIVSSATIYQIAPSARELGIEHILCTELEVEDGLFTGRAIHPTCFGTGKLSAASDLSDQLGIDLSDSYFYTDSEDDLPLLQNVGHPRSVNPSTKLRRTSRSEGWKICDFEERSRVKISDVIKNASVFAAMPTALMATAPYQFFSGRKRTSLNAAAGMWSDFASAVIGIDYEIEGEEHLWAKRPAVFIFNHQSAADVVILPKLLRRDFTAIGKKEIRKFPIIGQAMAYADVVFIDRASKEKSIEAMQPVVEALRNEGLSVCIAPEGTRSVGRGLGPFKKGPFQIARQAGVPIVPIVIHNASDCLPKSRNIMRPATIKITVLKPISTKKWTDKNIEAKIAKVRQKFLTTLGQE